MDSTKARASEQLRAGEPVYHPRYGFGVVRGLLDQGSSLLMGKNPDGAAGAYYEIEIIKEGRLFVPIARATAVGLRRLSNSLATILRCLASDAIMLPENTRERAAWLREREQAREPEALPEAVRDLIAVRSGSTLSNSERKWLDQACRRLSAEASIVDRIAESEAHAAILAAVAAGASPVSSA
jgi:RNA polymerase-interacting CarD/CdnL/TRCF family regulator